MGPDRWEKTCWWRIHVLQSIQRSVRRVKETHPLLPFRSVPFRWLWFSSGLATGAQLMERTTTAWLVLQLGGGALAVGLAFAARSLPSLLFGLAAGTVADRVDRRRQLLTVASIALMLMTFTGWLTGTGAIRVWQVIAIAFAVGCIQMSDSPARQALVLDTTSRDEATLSMTLNALASRGFGAVGAISAGALIPWIGVSHAYYVIAAVYGFELFPLLALRVPKIVRSSIVHPPFRRALRDALGLILNLPAVRVLTISGIAGEVLAFSHSSALPVLARDVLKAGPEGLGTLNAALSIGGTLSLVLLLSFQAHPASATPWRHLHCVRSVSRRPIDDPQPGIRGGSVGHYGHLCRCVRRSAADLAPARGAG